MAAGVGNCIFHFMRDIQNVAMLGLSAALRHFSGYVIYSLVLAIAISVSQLRAKSARAQMSWYGQGAQSCCVMAFYCVLQVFNTTNTVSLSDRFRFLGHLFGINL